MHSSRKWGLAQCKSTCEEHAGSDISFENITRCLDQLPLKIQFTKENRTLKTLVLCREANTLPQCKSSCKERASSDKNLSVKTLFRSAATLNTIYKANQSTNCPFKLEIVLKLAHQLNRQRTAAHWITQSGTTSCKYKTMTSPPKYGVLLAPKYGQKCKC